MQGSAPDPDVVTGHSDELGSWKEIADYLRVNTRTAQKWESQRGLPVRRSPGAKGRVSADPAALDRWRQANLDRPRWWSNLAFLRAYSVAATVVAVAAIALALSGYLRTRPRGKPALFRVEFRTLYVLNDRAAELWRWTFDEPLAVSTYAGDEGQARIWFGDLDGDRHIETLFAFHSSRVESKNSALMCFSESGTLKWRFSPAGSVSDRVRSYAPPYIVSAFAVIDAPGRRGKAVAVASRHAVYHPSNFSILDVAGRVTGEYWHAGHLDYLAFSDLDDDGVQEILLTGVNNISQAATLVVLDPRDFSGASDQEAGTAFQFAGLPIHREKAVLFFPRTCINEKFERYNMARNITITPERLIRIGVYERLDEDQLVVYTLDRRLNCIGADMSDRLIANHRRLEGEGVLDHALSDAELRRLRDIRVIRYASSAGR